jgi:hypothetical protein
MTKPKARLDAWAEAQKHFHLSDLHIQMTRELGLNPKISSCKFFGDSVSLCGSLLGEPQLLPLLIEFDHF